MRGVRLHDEDEVAKVQASPYLSECNSLLKMAVPLAVANLMDRSALWVTWAFIGQHGGAAQLGPASLASTVNNVLGTSVNIGLSLAVQTLASQAAGAGDWKALSNSLQRALPISVCFSLPVTALLLSLGPLLKALGRPPEVADAAQAYAFCILPVALVTGSQRAMTSWLAALGITRPLLLINLSLVPFHCLLAYFLVFHTSLGYLGAGISTSIQAVLRVVLTYAYIRCSPKCAHAWSGFRVADAFSGWAGYLRIALPGVLFLAEFWVGEFLVFCAAMLPNPAVGLSALTVYQLTNGTCYQPPGGLRVAVASRVGNALGAARPLDARRTYLCGLLLVVTWIGVPAVLLFAFPIAWGRIFTDDDLVVRMLVRLAPWLVLYVSLDALLAIGAGALTGCGRQGIGGRFALLAYVAIGLPVALALAFHTPLAVVGIVMGHTLGKLVMTAAIFVVVLRTRWSDESDKAIKRVKKVLAMPDGEKAPAASSHGGPELEPAGEADEPSGSGGGQNDSPDVRQLKDKELQMAAATCKTAFEEEDSASVRHAPETAV
jgi:MATE family multidrug resistance protein